MTREISSASSLSFSAGSLVSPPGLFRLILAAGVLLSHVSRIDIGRLAVLLFFLLSGYWTARIWNEKFGAGSTLRFYAARYLRVAPLCLLVTFAAALFRQIAIYPENLTIFGVATTERDPTGVAWSLDIELQFYLLVPLLFAFLSRISAWLAVLLSVAVGLLGCWLEARHELLTVAKYLPVFVLGLLIYLKAWRPSLRTALLSLAGFAVMTLVTIATPFFDKTTTDPFDQDIWAFIWLVPLLPYVAASLQTRGWRIDRDLGNLSFPLYLVHYPILSMAYLQFGDAMWVKALGVGASLVVAVAIYIFVDRPLDRIRVRLTESTPAKAN